MAFNFSLVGSTEGEILFLSRELKDGVHEINTDNERTVLENISRIDYDKLKNLESELWSVPIMDGPIRVIIDRQKGGGE